MKPILRYTLLLALIICFITCKKDDAQPTELPAATTTGAMTFGCKINGQIFVPKDGNGKSGLNPEYVNLGTGVGGGWFLNIPAVDWKSSSIPLISITTDSLLLTEGMTYSFKNAKGYPKASYFIDNLSYVKIDNDQGEIHITKFDPLNHILSGTFSFIGTDSRTGQKVTVTDGRFDITY